MPKEVRKRGRRAEESRRNEREAAEAQEQAEEAARQEEYEQRQALREQEKEQMAFYGLVSDQESEYFKQAESTLAVDAFGSAEERLGFVASVFEEARGKELKLMTNQICSKLVERLILLANDAQLSAFFRVFNGHFVNLSQHKYSSHCIETLFVRCAAIVEKEILDPDYLQAEMDSDTPYVSMENLFMFMVNELKPKIRDMPQHAYASHVLRVVLLVMAGKNLPSTTTSRSTLRSKRSKIARKMISIKDNEDFERAYQVPASFKESLTELIGDLRKDLDTTSAREMSIHKISSPVIQLMLQFECDEIRNKSHGKRKVKIPKDSLLSLIFVTKADEPRDSSEEAFVEYLLSDPVGSHFIEAIIPYLPDKVLERLTSLYMLGRMEKLARRDSGNFVVQALLKTSAGNTENKKKILDEIMGSSELLDLLCSSNLVMIRTLLDIAAELGNYRSDELVQVVLAKYDSEKDASNLIPNLLKLEGSTLGNTRGDWPTPEEMHRSLLLQSLMTGGPAKVRTGVLEGLIALPKETLLNMSKHSVFSHVLETAMETTADNIIQRRKLLNNLSGIFAPDLACNVYGSHIVDKCWRFTYKLKFFREKVAEELVANEETVKNSPYGRSVWKNWKMDKYVRKRHDWWNEVKAEEDEIMTALGTTRSANGMVEKPKKEEEKPIKEEEKTNNAHGKKDFKPRSGGKPFGKSFGNSFGKSGGGKFSKSNQTSMGNRRHQPYARN